MSHLTAVAFAAKVSETEALMRALQGLGLDPEYHEEPVQLQSRYTRSGYDKKVSLANIVVRSSSIEKAFGIAPTRECEIGFLAVGDRYEFTTDDFALGQELYQRAVTVSDSEGKDFHLGIKEAITLAFSKEVMTERLGKNANVKVNFSRGSKSPSLVLFGDESKKTKKANYSTVKRAKAVKLSR